MTVALTDEYVGTVCEVGRTVGDADYVLYVVLWLVSDDCSGVGLWWTE